MTGEHQQTGETNTAQQKPDDLNAVLKEIHLNHLVISNLLKQKGTPARPDEKEKSAA